ncbi:MAG: tetratricopeptide repeat protein [Tepidisphaeraceae bacterium]|jgi:predicted O-linked N-acetylglucosamine transferase (SPINDLY family)
MNDPSVDQLYDQAVQRHQAGQLHEAAAAYRQILRLQPDHADALHLLGVIVGQNGQRDEALKLIRQAIALNPKQANYQYNVGIVLTKSANFALAADAYREALNIRENFPEAWHSLGDALYAMGKFEESVAAYRKALKLKPRHIEAHNNLGMSLLSLGKYPEAAEEFREALALRPEYPRASNNLGMALQVLGQWEEAIVHFRRAVRFQPDFSDACNNLGKALMHESRYLEGQSVFEKLVELRPSDPESYFNLGCAQRMNYRHEQALDSFTKAIELAPRALSARNNRAAALNHLGRLTESIEEYDRILKLDPDFISVDSNRIFTFMFHPGYDTAKILAEARGFNERHAQPLAKQIKPHLNDRNPKRRLRIGYLSPDFRNHCQQFFTYPLLSHHDRTEFEIYLYADVEKQDSTTKDMRSYPAVWREIDQISDKQAVEMIREDKIDILMDLTMHMSDSRRLIYARKPAPIQVAWLAYPGTTGMATIDYRLTDPYLDPPGENDADYSERSIRLPHTFWCYDPRTSKPSVNPLPALANGFITFGCMNNFAKVSEPALRLWSKVLKQIPNSRLILMAPLGRHCEQIPQMLEVDPQRVEIISFQPRERYLQTYHRIDLGLDTTPYNGHTTSLDSLWMGVPVITLVGKTVVGRAGWSQLSNLDLRELAAFNEADFVRIAVDLAADLPRLADLRAGLRPRMEKSPLMDQPLFVKGLEEIYRKIWRDFCQTPLS